MDMASKGNATVHSIYLFPCLETKVYINCLDEFTLWDQLKQYILLYVCYIEYLKHTFSSSISQNVVASFWGHYQRTANKCCMNIDKRTSDKINMVVSLQ